MPCPECLSDDVEVHEYDFGICPQTDYHDAGERFRCRACGAIGDADDLVRESPTIGGAAPEAWPDLPPERNEELPDQP